MRLAPQPVRTSNARPIAAAPNLAAPRQQMVQA
jgi:hypothetical protein